MGLWFMKWRSVWPIFYSPVILSNFFESISYIILWIMNLYDPRFDLKINVGHCDLYFMVKWFGLISWTLFNVWTFLFQIMNQYNPKVDISHSDLYFMVLWFYVAPCRQFNVWTSYFWIMDQYDLTFDLKINVSLCDIYFMPKGFCFISQTSFDA